MTGEFCLLDEDMEEVLFILSELRFKEVRRWFTVCVYYYVGEGWWEDTRICLDCIDSLRFFSILKILLLLLSVSENNGDLGWREKVFFPYVELIELISYDFADEVRAYLYD